MTGDRDWLYVGAPVVTLSQPAGSGEGGFVSRTTVEKIGKRDIVLANGERFNANSLVRHRGTWDPSTFLLPPNDPRLGPVVAANRIARRRRDLALAVKALDNTPTRPNVEAVIEAARLYLMVLPE